MDVEATGHRARRLFEGARQVNRNPQLVELARRARERMLGGDRQIDLLSTARGRPSDLAARQLLALRADSPGVLGELGLTGLQTWQRLAESQNRGHGKVDVAILFTDLVGFSTWALDAGDTDALRLLREVADAIEPPIMESLGTVVKRLGDGVMAAFWDASTAVGAAFLANERVAPIEVAGYRPQLRTGIHLGRPRKLGGDYFGVDVNIAARLTEAAGPGEILVSDRVLERLPAGASRAKRRRLSAKGVPKDLAAFTVTPSG